ncbi:SFU1 [Candida pseudojiufengensis]|uniref:SFU1 n=1 Tax=Candida pseudojiufengensis TaxID=497109 RepID=UPI002225962B|nr:SFU1 [Candida pseudojiufengensis]KAI5961390.1 SFU1 [Candida pseudojiufengensis]
MNNILNNNRIQTGLSPKPLTPTMESEPEGSNTTNSSIIAPKIHTISVDDGQQCSNCGTTKTPLWRRAPDGTLICNACGLYLRSNNTHRPVNLKRPPNTITVAKIEEGSCKGDGRCNGTGGSAACKGCPAFNNRIVAKKSLEKSPKSENQIYATEITNQYLQNQQQSSDHNLKRSSPIQDSNKKEDENSLAIACFNCDTTITPLWRRDDAGNTICNACGLFYRLHGSHRPIKMKRATIKRRKRNGSSNHENKDGSRPNDETKSPKVKTNESNQSLNQLTSQPPYPTQQQYPPITSSNSNYLPIPTNYNRNLPYSLPFHRTTNDHNPNQNSTTPPPLQFPQHSQHSAIIPPSLYPRYNGSGRLPNGPGPMPGPPPPINFGTSFNQSQQQQLTHQIPQQRQETPPSIKIPDIAIDPNTLPPIKTNEKGEAIGSGCCTNCTPLNKRVLKPKPMAIDFTSSYKVENSFNSNLRNSSIDKKEEEEEDDSENNLLKLKPSLAKNNGNGNYNQKKALTIGGLLNN